MNEDLPHTPRRDFMKALGVEHLNAEEIQLFRGRKLDKDIVGWAVLHISECPPCCSLAPDLTAEEIANALAGTP